MKIYFTGTPDIEDGEHTLDFLRRLARKDYGYDLTAKTCDADAIIAFAGITPVAEDVEHFCINRVDAKAIVFYNKETPLDRHLSDLIEANPNIVDICFEEEVEIIENVSSFFAAWL